MTGVALGAAVAVASVARTVLAGVAPAASPAPSPSPTTVEIPPEDLTSPGLLGFLVTFGVAIALVFLARSFVRHLRVVESRSRELEDDGAGAVDPDADARLGTPTPGAISPTGPAADEGPDPDDRRPAAP